VLAFILLFYFGVVAVNMTVGKYDRGKNMTFGKYDRLKNMTVRKDECLQICVGKNIIKKE
jgi:UV DNA damage repair endonuclease